VGENGGRSTAGGGSRSWERGESEKREREEREEEERLTWLKLFVSRANRTSATSGHTMKSGWVTNHTAAGDATQSRQTNRYDSCLRGATSLVSHVPVHIA
jgi:hypothetical protein